MTSQLLANPSALGWSVFALVCVLGFVAPVVTATLKVKAWNKAEAEAAAVTVADKMWARVEPRLSEFAARLEAITLENKARMDTMTRMWEVIEKIRSAQSDNSDRIIDIYKTLAMNGLSQREKQ
jgi:hypothetical protein